MPLFFRKPDSDREERDGCAVCVYARIEDGGEIFCTKRKKQVGPFARCAVYEFDLLKRKPAGGKAGASIIEEFEQVMEEEKKRT